MKTPADIITRLQLMSQDGTKSDRRLASLVLSDLDFASKAAISEIAARVGVSEPTVTRFCRNLGCEGLRDFKFYLAQAIAIGGQYLSPEPLNRDVREQRIASVITDAAISAIQRASENLDMTTLVAVAARIASSGNVLCIGSGGISSMMATEMQNRLFRLGLSTLAQVDGQLQRMYAAVATPETTLVAFSVFSFAMPLNWVTPKSLADIALFVGVGIMSAGAQVMTALAYRHGTTHHIAPFSYFSLVMSIGVGWLVFGAIPDGWSFTGMAVIALAGVVTVLRR